MATLLLTGDINLIKVTDPAVPFGRIEAELKKADAVFGNLECLLYERPSGHSTSNEGFFADPDIAGAALKRAGIHAVGIANNVHYGEAAILSSIARLDQFGIAHTGAGANLAAARAPVILDRGGVRFGFLQRSSVYWPTNHEARKGSAGIAVMKGHTAYHVPVGRLRPGMPPFNRPGVPPEIVTWADRDYLASFKDDIAELRPQVDVLVASCHWGLGPEVLAYMTDIAHGAIDAGADIVYGHGPHYALPVEVYKRKPVFYGVSNLSFHTGHGDQAHGDWIGLLVRVTAGKAGLEGASFRFVRHNDRNESFFCDPDKEPEALTEMTAASKAARLTPVGHEVHIDLKS
jgi:poly-gamma-glutamate capsule biosynthesis protein CapA/YwtB (metallophosphatase superfamily)